MKTRTTIFTALAAILLLVAALLIVAVIMPAMADEGGEELTVVNDQEPDSGGTPLLGAEDALLRDAQGYASDMGVSTDEALHRLQLQDSIGELGAELSTNEVETFAGLWIEHTPKYRVVVQFTRDSEDTIKPYLEQHTELADIVEVRTANVSLADLQKAQANVLDSVRALGIPADSGISVDTNSVELYMTKADRGRFDDALQRGEVRLSDKVRVITVEAEAMGILEADIYGGLPGSLDVEYNYFFGLDPARHEVIVTYGKLPELETEEQRQNWFYSLEGLEESLKTELPSSYMHPNGKVMTCGSNSRGYFVILFYENLTKTDPLIDEIYTMIDEKAKNMGIRKIPVEFGCGVYYYEYEIDDNLPEPERTSVEEFMRSGRGIYNPEVIATYGTLPEFETKEQWRNWTDENQYYAIIEGLNYQHQQGIMDSYFYPAGHVIGYGIAINGYITVTIYENLTVEKPLLNEIYAIIDEEAKKNGIHEVPVMFIKGGLIIADDGLLVEDSNDDVSLPDAVSGESVPGFGLLGGLISLFGGWLFRRKRA